MPGQRFLGFFTNGTFVGGRYTQSNEDGGRFFTYTVRRAAPEPTATPGPTETPDPEDHYLSFYGSYTLSNGDKGIFVLSVDVPGTDAGGGGFHQPPDGYEITPGSQVQGGDARVTLQISGSTGRGSVSLSNGLTGTIIIDQRYAGRFSSQSARSLRSLPSDLRAYIKRR